MTRSEIMNEILKLDLDEQIRLAEELWKKVGDDDLTDEEWAEIERRGAELDANPEIGISWEELHLRS